ncbi:MAG: serine protease [Alphaproteobacteria bacterium]
MLRALPAFVFILVLGSAAVAEAQVPSDIMNLFGTIMNAAGAEAQRQQARDAWSKASPDLVACMQQHYSAVPQQLAEQGVGPYDPRIRAQVERCNQWIAAQQQKAQADEEHRQQARDAWMQVDPEVIACVDRSYSSTSQQLAEQGIGPRDPRVARYVNRCVDIVTTERNRAERQKAEREQEIAKKKREEAAAREKAAQEAKQEAQAEAVEKEAAQKEQAARKAAEAQQKKAEAEKAAADEKMKKEQDAEIESNPKLQFLGSGASEDLIAIVNVGAKAPHAVVDLHGQLTFTDGVAAICVGEKTELSPIEKRLYNQNLAAVKADSNKLKEGHCNNAAALEALDMLVLRRTEILKGTLGGVGSLIKGLSSDTYVKGFIITADDVKAANDKREVELSTLKNAIEKGTIKGYGVIAVSNDGKLFCNTAAELAKIFPDLSHDLMSTKDFENINPAKLQAADVDTDTAFISLKKEQCRAVFGNADSLRTLMDGLTRDKVAFSLDGRWIPEETIAAYEQGKSEQEKKHLQEEAEARQRLAAEKELAERRAEETGKINAEKQGVLRAANGARVTSLKNDYLKHTEELVQSSKDAVGSTHLGKLHPELAQWYQARLSEGWEFVSSAVDVLDYGTSTWKGRALEAFVVTSTIRIRHRALGEYKELCYVGAHIVDVEFSMTREPLYVTCDGARLALGRWKASFDFKSKWNIENAYLETAQPKMTLGGNFEGPTPLYPAQPDTSPTGNTTGQDKAKPAVAQQTSPAPPVSESPAPNPRQTAASDELSAPPPARAQAPAEPASAAAIPAPPAKPQGKEPPPAVAKEGERADATHALAQAELIRRIERGTVLILTEISGGSGFFVKPTVIVTNRHVVAGTRTGRVLVTSKSLGRVVPGRVFAATASNDIGAPDFALIEVPPDTGAEPLALSESAGKLLGIIAAGYPGLAIRHDVGFRRLLDGDLTAAPDLSVNDGKISAIQDSLNGTRQFLHSAEVLGGNSGGPLIDNCGRVVGVNTFIAVDRQQSGRISYALSAHDLLLFLKRKGIAVVPEEAPCR